MVCGADDTALIVLTLEQLAHLLGEVKRDAHRYWFALNTDKSELLIPRDSSQTLSFATIPATTHNLRYVPVLTYLLEHPT